MNHQEPTTVTAFSLADVWMEREQLRADLAAARTVAERVCVWLPREGDEFSWDTGCGKWTWTEDGGTPQENGNHFCFNCGGRVVLEVPKPEREK